MLRAWWFMVSFALYCALGGSSAYATTPNAIKPIGGVSKSGLLGGGMNKSGLLKPVTELAKGGSTIKNGILYLEPPIKFTLPGGTKVEQSELDLVKAFKFTAWSGASLSIGTALNTVLNTALPPHISCLFWCRSPDEIDKMKGE